MAGINSRHRKSPKFATAILPKKSRKLISAQNTESQARTSAGLFTEDSGQKKRPLCRHCQAEPVTRPRGLGWKCYYTPGLREQYQSNSRYATSTARGEAKDMETLEDVDRIIAEQYKRLPDWWHDDWVRKPEESPIRRPRHVQGRIQ